MFVMALLCHETSFVIPFYLFSIFYLFYKESFSRSFCLSLPLFMMAALFGLFRLKYASLGDGILNKIRLHNISVVEYLATFTSLI